MAKKEREINFWKKYSYSMNQPIIKNFLKDKANYELLKKAINNKDNDSKKELNKRFQKYYKNIKAIHYISKLIHFYSIDYDKRINNYKSRNIIASMKDYNYVAQNSYMEEKKLNTGENLTLKDFEHKQSLLNQIEDKDLYERLKELTELQIDILELFYVYNLTNKEISKLLGKSAQTIS